jgi:predicted nucleotidyltransferase
MSLKNSSKHKIIQEIRNRLSQETNIVFAYVHGSFLDEDTFNDVDIAVFVEKNTLKPNPVDFEISWSLKLEKSLNISVDVKILNAAPLSFRYHATKGKLIIDRDEEVREEFLCRTWSDYFDFKPVSKIYLMEALNA